MCEDSRWQTQPGQISQQQPPINNYSHSKHFQLIKMVIHDPPINNQMRLPRMHESKQILNKAPDPNLN